MPIGMEEWRASVGSNNAARSHALGKFTRRKCSRSFLSFFISYLVALFTERTWFSSNNTSEPYTVTSYSPDVTTPTTCSSTHKNKKIGVVVMLCIGLFIAIVAGVLYRSGDIETNPGPEYDLIPDNLGKLQDSLWNSRTKWFNLGLRLGIDEETLKMLKQNYSNGEDCFREMLSEWLKTADPTWKELLTALTRPSVGCERIAKKVRQELGIPEQRPKDKISSTRKSTVSKPYSSSHFDCPEEVLDLIGFDQSGIQSSSDSVFLTDSDSDQNSERPRTKRSDRSSLDSEIKIPIAKKRKISFDVKKYSDYLKLLYTEFHNEKKSLASFKLARIEKEKVNTELDEFSKNTLRGDQDDVVYSKYHIEENEIALSTGNKQPRLILIEGAPGVGKTTFSEEFCFKWSQGELLKDHRLLILLPLRDKTIKSAKIISDFFTNYLHQELITRDVERNNGKGVALWIEAWDELRDNKTSIFSKLVNGRVLPEATIIVTSRPWATKNFKADQHIEVVSTSTIQLSRILNNHDYRSIRAELKRYVNINPSIKAAMHTPVTADIVAEVFKWNQDAPPKTTTQLYTALLRSKLLSGKADGQKGSLEDVAAEESVGLVKICNLAWHRIIKQQLAFSESDVVAAIGEDTLGLLHKVREVHGGEDGQFSYHFIHLTLQEFLSAYRIQQLPQDVQNKAIEHHIETKHLNMVVRFYFGLTKFLTPKLINMQFLQDDKQATVYHWLFEAGDIGIDKLGVNEEISVSSSYSWNPLDYYVVGHCISRYQNQWKLNFNNTSIGDEGMEMLSKGMASNTNTAHSGEIEGNFRRNQITSEGLESFPDIPSILLQKIKKLDFGTNKLNAPALSTLCKATSNLTNLQEFCLSSNSIGKGGTVKMLQSLCDTTRKIPLKKLDLAITDIGEEDCAQLAQLTHLEYLDVGGNKLSSISIASIINGQRKINTIQKLHMSDSNLSEENCMSLSSLLEEPACQLRELNISLCHISGEGAVHLGIALTQNVSLKKLNIMENPIGDLGAAALGHIIMFNSSLETLYLTSCGITSRGFVQLATGLIYNASLKTLWLGSNKCGMEGAKAIADMMKENKTLQVLALECDALLKKRGIAEIMDGLQMNKTLQELWLSKQYKFSAGSRVKWI